MEIFLFHRELNVLLFQALKCPTMPAVHSRECDKPIETIINITSWHGISPSSTPLSMWTIFKSANDSIQWPID